MIELKNYKNFIKLIEIHETTTSLYLVYSCAVGGNLLEKIE